MKFGNGWARVASGRYWESAAIGFCENAARSTFSLRCGNGYKRSASLSHTGVLARYASRNRDPAIVAVGSGDAGKRSSGSSAPASSAAHAALAMADGGAEEGAGVHARPEPEKVAEKKVPK